MRSLVAVCLLFLCSAFILSSCSAATGSQEDVEKHATGLLQIHREAEPSLLMHLLRSKRHSNLSLCRYCCKCCKNKECGFCCLS